MAGIQKGSAANPKTFLLLFLLVRTPHERRVELSTSQAILRQPQHNQALASTSARPAANLDYIRRRASQENPYALL